MADWQELSQKTRALTGTWAGYTALGSFALYLLGYLSLRFHLTALGIGTDLAVLDERYLFAGARFLTYLVSSVPIVLLAMLVLSALVYVPYRVLPRGMRARVGRVVQSRWERLRAWWSHPTRLALTGVVLSLLIIQLVMRQCFLLSDLLVTPRLPEPRWLQALLLDEPAGLTSPYFAGLLAVTAATAGLLILARRMEAQTLPSRALAGLLAFLVSVQFLMLPVNYGILIARKKMPRVAGLGGHAELATGQEAWLIWEGTEGMTYLVRGNEHGKAHRSLVTLPRRDIKKVEITRYDHIYRILFREAPGSDAHREQRR